MPKRTYPADASRIIVADDLQDAVHDKREGWRANPTKARRRQRRYTGLLTRELMKQGGVEAEE
ncbi:hypothetical protein [Sandarakinorhabdus sp.]|uniref:hypothetical protein n=1 Tax=Sandarakinorhabdus sp. TaxID=1916663 RepID=UPI00356A0E40